MYPRNGAFESSPRFRLGESRWEGTLTRFLNTAPGGPLLVSGAPPPIASRRTKTGEENGLGNSAVHTPGPPWREG